MVAVNKVYVVVWIYLFMDFEGDAVKEIHAEPTFVKKIVKKSVSPSMQPGILTSLAPLLSHVATFGEEKEPPKDMILIGMQITNSGDVPAQGIRVSLRFPANCRVMEEHDVTGGIRIGQPQANSGGLFVDTEESEAYAWIDTLGNDLTMRSFEKVYARFPETEQQYRIQGHITQYGFLPPITNFRSR